LLNSLTDEHFPLSYYGSVFARVSPCGSAIDAKVHENH
jgi:hypothetical protein